MDKRIHAIITTKPEKRHLLRDVGKLVVNEFGETVVLLEYSTAGFWIWKRVTLEFEVVEDAHYLCHDSVVLINDAIMDRDGDIRVDTFELEDVSEEKGCCCCCKETKCEAQQPDTGEVEVEESDKEESEGEADENEGEAKETTHKDEPTGAEGEKDEFADLRSPGFYMSP